MKTQIKLIAASAALVLSQSMIATATAGPMPETVSISKTVKFDRASIETTEGASALYTKLRSAASHVCRSLSASVAIESGFDRSDCISNALATAVEKVDGSTLTALHEGVVGADVTASR
jgi:UrcA family protein